MNDQPIPANWRSQEGLNNALALQATYPAAFAALAELDALGHRLLHGLGTNLHIDRIDSLVAVALLRRTVTQFVGIRHLLEASVVEHAKLGLRAQFETLLSVRYLLYGAKGHIDRDTPSSPTRRESRARYYFVAADRLSIYARFALLDGHWGRSRIPRKQRSAIRREAFQNLARLDKEFPVQQNAFGPLLCLPSRRGKPRYHDSRQWFSFGFRTSKVTTIRHLASRLGYLREYEMLYAALSGLTHPRGVSHDVKLAGDHLSVYHPYMAEAFELLCAWACGWQTFLLAWFNLVYDPGSFDDAKAVFIKNRPAIKALNARLPDGFF